MINHCRCSICGFEGNITAQCCGLSASIPLDKFAQKLFPGCTMSDTTSKNYVPYSTVREFYADYRTSGMKIKEYVKMTNSNERWDVDYGYQS